MGGLLDKIKALADGAKPITVMDAGGKDTQDKGYCNTVSSRYSKPPQEFLRYKHNKQQTDAQGAIKSNLEVHLSLASLKDSVRRWIEEHDSLACLLLGFGSFGLLFLVHRHFVSASPADFLAFFMDPGKVRAFASEGYNEAYQVIMGTFGFADWLSVWTGIVGYAWNTARRSRVLRFLAFLFLLIPPVAVCSWSAGTFVRSAVLFNYAVAAVLTVMMFVPERFDA